MSDNERNVSKSKPFTIKYILFNDTLSKVKNIFFSKMQLMINSYDRWSVVEIVSPVRLRWPKNTHLEWDLRRKRSECEPSSDVGDNPLLVCRGE